MSRSIIAIDDTGSPGKSTRSRFLHPDRKTFVAMLFTPAQREAAEAELPECLEYVREFCPIQEFHFVELYNRTGNFRGLTDAHAKAILFAFCEIFSTYRPPVLVQTCDPDFFRKNGMSIRGAPKLDGLRVADHKQFALLFLLMRCKWYLEKHPVEFPRPIDVVIDEGVYKAGHRQPTHVLKDIASDGVLTFTNSKTAPVLQLADFAAFALNRMQLLSVKGKDRTAFDNEVLEVFGRANINYVNIEKVSSTLEELDAEAYDYGLHTNHAINGALARQQALERLQRGNPGYKAWRTVGTAARYRNGLTGH
jgi:hypothetical protein